MRSFLLITSLITAVPVYSQWTYIPPPVQVFPANPTELDEVKIVRRFTSGNQSSLMDSSTWSSGNLFILNLCYANSGLTSPSSHYDTINLGKLRPGLYDIKHVATLSNSSTNCDFYYSDQADTSFFVEKATDSTLQVEPVSNKNILVAPNPFNKTFSLINPPENCHLQIIDITGKLVYEKDGPTHTPQLPSGFYILHVYSYGNLISSSKIQQTSL